MRHLVFAIDADLKRLPVAGDGEIGAARMRGPHMHSSSGDSSDSSLRPDRCHLSGHALTDVVVLQRQHVAQDIWATRAGLPPRSPTRRPTVLVALRKHDRASALAHLLQVRVAAQPQHLIYLPPICPIPGRRSRRHTSAHHKLVHTRQGSGLASPLIVL